MLSIYPIDSPDESHLMHISKKKFYNQKIVLKSKMLLIFKTK